MSGSEEKTERIDRYLMNLLDSDELRAFELEMESDSTFKEEVEIQQQLTLLLEEDAKERMRSKVRGIHNRQKTSSASPWKLTIAAILVLGLIAVPTYYFLTSEIDNVQLASNYFEPYPDRITQMGDEKNELTDALEAYNNADYSNAAIRFEKIVSDSSNLVNLYLSISYYKTNEFSKASENIGKSLERMKKSNPLYSVNRWYQLLTALKANKIDETKELLTDYLDKKHLYKRDKAQSLAKDLGLK